MNNEKTKLNVPRPNAYIYITRFRCRYSTIMCHQVRVCVRYMRVCAGVCAHMNVYIVTQSM